MTGAFAGRLSGTYQYIETQLGSVPTCHPDGTCVNDAADAGALASRPAQSASGAASRNASREAMPFLE